MHRSKCRPLMSALGHKQIFAAQKGMSALPPKADIDSAMASNGMTFVSPRRSLRG